MKEDEHRPMERSHIDFDDSNRSGVPPSKIKLRGSAPLYMPPAQPSELNASGRERLGTGGEKCG